MFVGHQVDRAGTSGWVAVGADGAGGFVQGVADSLGRAERHAVDANLLLERIDASAQFDDHATIDFNSAGKDDFLTLAPAAQARGGQDFLQTLLWLVGGLAGGLSGRPRRRLPFSRATAGHVGPVELGDSGTESQTRACMITERDRCQ